MSTSFKDEQTRIHAWYDSAALDSDGDHGDGARLLARAIAAGYTAVVLYPGSAERHLGGLPDQVTRILHVASAEEWDDVVGRGLIPQGDARRTWVVSSHDAALLSRAAQEGVATCLRMSAHDQDSLKAAIELGRAHRYLAMRFPDPTNIPLELVIASLQSHAHDRHQGDHRRRRTPRTPSSASASWRSAATACCSRRARTSTSTTSSPRSTRRPSRGWRSASRPSSRRRPIGMGHRSCIDLATIFEPDEGMLVGSTSQGGILCCPEVFYLPYMELRPFRVNAGGVHSYVYASNNRTNYLSELKAGSPAMVVGIDGRTREVPVGRIKTEIRPLRLIEVEFESGERANIIMQDDWHVRVFSKEGQPLNITELKAGDKVLGHIATPGRHVGIPVDETIQEA